MLERTGSLRSKESILHYNDGYSADVMRQTWINDDAEARLMADTSGAESEGSSAWSCTHNCTEFATGAWAIATGENIREYNAFGIGSPSTTADSIRSLNGGHDYAFHFTDGGNGYYFSDGSFGRYDSNGNGYYIWDPNGGPGDQIGQTTDGQPIYQGKPGGGGGGSGGGGGGYFSGSFIGPGASYTGPSGGQGTYILMKLF